ncbi:MAG: hypothetical protein ACE5K1_00185 [Acidiferrobacterales bacterium]
MWESDDFEADAGGTVFRDVLMLALVGFVAMVIMLLPHLSKTKKEEDEHRAPGNVVIEIHWPNELPVDVDLWVRAPEDVAVGFFNQGSRFFNLLRDDLGLEGDASKQNYEVSYSRGIPSGEYIANVHMYGPLPAGVTVPVTVVVSVRKKYDTLRQILQTQVELRRRNQEETAFRFKLDEEGELIPDSVTTLRRRLVTAPS